VLQGPGENAGCVSIGDGLAVVFKIESHNHPSFIEPRQGAATGVGGILRDIFTMGARPIASLDSLRFGPLEDPKHRYLVHGDKVAFGGRALEVRATPGHTVLELAVGLLLAALLAVRRRLGAVLVEAAREDL